MTHRDVSRTLPRRAPWILGGAVAVAAVAAAMGPVQRASSSATSVPPAPSLASSTATPASSGAGAKAPTATLHADQRGELGAAAGAVRSAAGLSLGAADGVLPAHTTVLDAGLPGVARLDAALLDALRHASADALRAGVHIFIDSGWRSATYQAQLFRQAVSEYGSAAKAARWVAPPGTSAHESGSAADIGPTDAVAWLSAYGAGYGLCQIYRNEPWHYELRPTAVERGCPRMYADPTKDPRTQQ